LELALSSISRSVRNGRICRVLGKQHRADRSDSAGTRDRQRSPIVGAKRHAAGECGTERECSAVKRAADAKSVAV